jgi:hypothetical protein
MTSLKLTEVGSATAAILPEEMLARMKVEKGGTLFAIETSGGYFITSHDPAVAQQVEAGLAFMDAYPETFQALAK